MIGRLRRSIVRRGQARLPIAVRLSLAALLIAALWLPDLRATHTQTITGLYTNPLRIQPNAAGPFESCADPAIIRGQQPGDSFWYLYCTDNPFNGSDRAANGRLNDHFIPILRSRDLIDWTYVGDAFSTRPSWITRFTGLWAPDIQYFNGRYYLYYTVVGTLLPGRESAIGVATSPTPIGPWTDSGAPVVESQSMLSGGNSRRWVFDSAVASDEAGRRFLFYGSFVGGIAARRLTADGLHTDPASEVPIASANRYEATSIVTHGGFYYLFVSAGECCNGPLSGYSVLVGRSTNLLGPYTDREGVSLLAGQVGGTPVLSANGNRWVGPGSNTVFTDGAGQDWFLYHAVDRTDPYFAGSAATKRPALLDRLDWIEGWPVVRGGLGPSDTPQPAPVAQSGMAAGPATTVPQRDPLGPLNGTFSLDFAALSADPVGLDAALTFGSWEWVRPPAADTVGLVDGMLRFATQAGNLADHTASILTEPSPVGDYAVETRVRLDLPPEGCCQNFVQAGLIIYGDDDNYIKLVHLSREQTRQIVFTEAVSPTTRRMPHEGNAVVGPASDEMYLRIVKRIREGEETYTAYSSRDGVQWLRGSTWAATLGSDARIGLVAMDGAGFTADFDYVRVYAMPPQ
jgi:arabinan endo-1,5-alpha-L-arabinosidase